MKVKTRYESFGGIICWEEPPALFYVDKQFMREFGYKDSLLWRKRTNYLSAPTEIHFSITNDCPMHCQHCYVDSGEKLKRELTTNEIKKAISILSSMQVFHIALGGGEPFARKDCLEIAHYCREKGLVPNITTNGYYITEKLAKECRVFGQINVSMDGIGEYYKLSRGHNGFPIADKALRLLTKYNPRVGINCVVSRDNFEHIPKLVEYAKKLNLHSILFLRYKPTGRAKELYQKRHITKEQGIKLLPLIIQLAIQNSIRLYIDCSFTPMLYYHKIHPKILDYISTHGCVAGDSLAGTLADGRINACSFAQGDGGFIFSIKKEWHSNPHFIRFRNWIKSAPEPCKSCDYLKLCRGGCHVVSEYVLGDFNAPDPGCPWVQEYNQKSERRQYVKG
ncbi:MAG: radical SAM protein [candidate division WOR-3 bacterium]